MNGKVLATLEYPKIIRRLSGHAETALGQARALALQPDNRLEEVKGNLRFTDEAAAVIRLKGGAPFGGIRDIRAALKRSSIGGTLNPAELLDIANTIAGGRKLERFLETAHSSHPIPSLMQICSRLSDERELERSIRDCIDDQAEVVDGASPELYRIRQELRGGEARVRDRLEQMIRSSSVQKMLQDQLITMRNDRYVIPVKQEYRGQLGGIVHDQSASGATLFIEPEVIVSMNNRLRELKVKEEREIERILQVLTARTAESADALAVHVEALGELDFVFAKAELAKEMKAVLPIMNDRGFIKLRKGRHPLIPAESVVPLDLELGNVFSTIIITGPNTGGKTVSLKTVGLLSLMVMSGLFVPAEDGSQMCVFDGVFADIGDEQSIEQNLSTFSSHMTNIIGILKEMTPKSLVLLDELGAGTDPAEGSALAIALLEHIHAMGCRTVSTTHYSELKAYAYERKGIINASMEFDVASLRPTYRLLVGVPGRSNAFAIAQRLGLPRPIIEHARSQVGDDDQRVETMIASLEQNRLSAEAERETAEKLRREVEQLRKELEQEKQRFAGQKDKLLEQAEREAREAVAKARREAEDVIAELRRLALEEGASVKEHKLIEAKRKLEDAAPAPGKRRPAAAKSGKSAKPIEAGDEVLVVSFGQKGHVVELVGAGEAVVQLGILKTKVALSELEPVGAKPLTKPKQQTAGPTVKRTTEDSARMELDLRGSNLEDAIIESDRFLDQSFLSGIGQVYLIHGKGTGVLRAGLQDYLRRHKHVKRYRLGNYGEGGAGVTVVELN